MTWHLFNLNDLYFLFMLRSVIYFHIFQQQKIYHSFIDYDAHTSHLLSFWFWRNFDNSVSCSLFSIRKKANNLIAYVVSYKYRTKFELVCNFMISNPYFNEWWNNNIRMERTFNVLLRIHVIDLPLHHQIENIFISK